jgi:DNA-binding FadR family transcriptional regulator
MNDTIQPLRKPKNLAHELVDALNDRIRDGRLKVGDKLPSEAAIMQQFGVSRTVVREAISHLQAAGSVMTRHGVGTFIVGTDDTASFKLTSEHFSTLRDVIAVLELRIGIETEAAALAASRRTEQNLVNMQHALAAIAQAIDAGEDAVAHDFHFHLEIARATQNKHFTELMASLGASIIPRARLDNTPAAALDPEKLSYLRKVNTEHDSIFQAIRNQDPDAARAAMRTHLSNSKERRRQNGF